MKNEQEINFVFEYEKEYTGLRNAIVMQAIRDYILSSKYVKKHKNPTELWRKRRVQEAKHLIKDVEMFFHSDYFQEICEIDPNYALTILYERAKENDNKIAM